MKEHSTFPWEVVEANEHHGAYIVPAHGGDVCDLYAMSNPTAASVRNGGNSYPVRFDNSEGNAELIVKAVNSHEPMMRALEQAKAALIKIRTCSIAGCEEGYGRPEKWADALFASHGDATNAINTIIKCLESV